MTRQLYERRGTDPKLVFSPYCWRSRMALAHKGLAFDSVPWRFTETARLAFAKPVRRPGALLIVPSKLIAGMNLGIIPHARTS